MVMTTVTRAVQPRRKYHHGDLCAALLAAASSIVTEEGVEALTMQACARRAGVSHAASGHHFGSLAGLVEEFAADERSAMRWTQLAQKTRTNRYSQLDLLTLVLLKNMPHNFALCRRSLPVQRNRHDCEKQVERRDVVSRRRSAPPTRVVTIASCRRGHFR